MPNYQYKQTFPNSCGASSLLCAAMELGTVQMPATPAYPLWTFAMNLATTQTCETAIYSVTGGGGGMPPSAASGYSMPSYIHDCARALGRNAVAYVPGSVIGALLNTVYQADVRRAVGNGMTVNAAAAPAPVGAQRLLRVMRVGEDAWYKPATGLHYIMERPDGSVMDPAVGMDANNLAALALFQKSQSVAYIDTGIGITIS